jgi:hypothetical protein
MTYSPSATDVSVAWTIRPMRASVGRAMLRLCMPVAIALADDSLIVREGVGQILATEPEMSVVASCGDLPSLLAAVDTQRPDVVVTDIRCRHQHRRGHPPRRTAARDPSRIGWSS